jgi:hypothetical protein
MSAAVLPVRRGGSAALALALAVLAAAGNAAALPTEAEELFRKGHALYDEGKLDQACALLARSQELDPSVGTLGLLAACEEKRGLLARAYADFVETARLAHAAHDDREAYARDRAAALSPKVSRLVLRVDPAGPPARVTRGGQEVPVDRLGAELPVDPGAFEVVATAPDGRAWRRALVAGPGQRLEVDIPAFKAADAGPAPPVTHPVARAFAFVTAGLGLAGVGVGAGFGARAISLNNASSDGKTCAPKAPTCPARDQAYTASTVSTAAFVVGLGAASASVALFVVSRPTPAQGAVSLSIFPSGTISLAGTF